MDERRTLPVSRLRPLRNAEADPSEDLIGQDVLRREDIAVPEVRGGGDPT